jgi:hypothetical protein
VWGAGSFLLRDSTSSPGDLVLSALECGAITHYKVTHHPADGSYSIGDKSHASLEEMIAFYGRNTLEESVLRHPLSRDDADDGAALLPRYLFTVKALYKFTPRDNDDLGFRKGELLNVLQQQQQDWWRAQSQSTYKVGFIPANYVQAVEPAPESSPAAAAAPPTAPVAAAAPLAPVAPETPRTATAAAAAGPAVAPKAARSVQHLARTQSVYANEPRPAATPPPQEPEPAPHPPPSSHATTAATTAAATTAELAVAAAPVHQPLGGALGTRPFVLCRAKKARAASPYDSFELSFKVRQGSMRLPAAHLSVHPDCAHTCLWALQRGRPGRQAGDLICVLSKSGSHWEGKIVGTDKVCPAAIVLASRSVFPRGVRVRIRMRVPDRDPCFWGQRGSFPFVMVEVIAPENYDDAMRALEADFLRGFA